jgi:protein phosphatase
MFMRMSEPADKYGVRYLASELRWAGLTDRGLVRVDNQDAYVANPAHGLFIVSDGMGGQNAGALASQVVISVLPGLIERILAGITDYSSYNSLHRVRGCLIELSNQVRVQTEGKAGLHGMGATVVLLLVRGNQALVAHMGDSRAYLHRSDLMVQLTKDHSVTQLLLDAGEITHAEAHNHPTRNLLRQFVGVRGEPLPEARFVPVEPGDRLLLCSDGLTGMLLPETIQDHLDARLSPEETCRKMVAAANAAGGKDNITVLLVDLPKQITHLSQ